MKKFVNPIIPNSQFYNTSDPYILRYNGFYYHCFSTKDGIYISESEELGDIGKATPVKVFDSLSAQLPSAFAPELHRINGKWYIYASPDMADWLHVMNVYELDSEHPIGKYKNLGMVHGLENKWSIDGTVTEYGGKLYFVWTSCAEMYLAELADPTTITGKTIVISKPELPFETKDGLINEGPAVLKRGNKLIVIYSANDSKCDSYCLGAVCFDGNGDILNAQNWKKINNALFEQTDGIYGPGHCSFTTATENGIEIDYIVYHANLESGTGWSGRSVWAQAFSWDENDMPVFGKPHK